MGEHRFSRREVLNSIIMLGGGSALAPLSGAGIQAQPAGVVRGALLDGGTGQATAAKMRVTAVATGEDFWPAVSIKTMPRKPRPGGWRYFYVRDRYEIALQPGTYDVEVVRGICHEAVKRRLEVRPGSSQVLDITIPVLRDLRSSGWYSGNTHTHYQVQVDENPDDRLRLVPPAEALDISVISYAIRGDLKYATNRYPVGRLPEFSRHGTLVDMGEECRNNKTGWDMGYGHVLFLNIPHLVEPVSTGLLSPVPNAPDFPTISMLCQEAKRIGGTTVWCHNGKGMELPVAAALGAIDAFNVGDSEEGEYGRYYQFLNCGFRIPISTGTDWWIYDHNRVFVQIDGAFNYGAWLKGFRAGRTFITNGPLITLSVNGRGPGSEVDSARPLRLRAEVVSRLPFERIEVVRDGEVVLAKTAAAGRQAIIEQELPPGGGWVAARVVAAAKTHGGFTVFAHTGPIYLRGSRSTECRREAAQAFAREMMEAATFIGRNYRFGNDADRAVAIGRFEQARRYYARRAEAP